MFIEQLLGVSPDGGSGLTECAVALTILALTMLPLLRRRLLRPA